MVIMMINIFFWNSLHGKMPSGKLCCLSLFHVEGMVTTPLTVEFVSFARIPHHYKQHRQEQ